MTWVGQRFLFRRSVLVLAIAAVVLVGAATAGYWALPRLVPEDRLREALGVHIASWSGGHLRLSPRADISVVAGPSVRIETAAFEGTSAGAAWRLETSTVNASLGMPALLRGRVEIETLRIDSPHLRLQRRDASAPADPSMTARARQSARSDPGGEVIVTDARVTYEGSDGRVTEIDGIDLRMAAERGSTAILLTGALPAGADRLRVRGRLEDPGAVFGDGASAARLEVRGAPPLATPGTTQPRPKADLPAAAPESRVITLLRRIAAAAGVVGTAPIVVEATVSATPRAIDLAEATVSFGGLLAEGKLTVALAGAHPPFNQMAGILRGATAAWSDARAAVAGGAWREAPVTLDWLAPLELELSARLRDSHLAGRDLEARRMLLKTRGGRARLELAVAGDLGEIRSDLMVYAGRTRGTPRFSAHGQVRNVNLSDAGKALQSLGPSPLVTPPPPPEGTLDADFDVVTRGETLGELVEAINGTLSAEARDGRLTGADVILTLESLADGRIIMTKQDGPLVPAAGRTDYDTARAKIAFRAGAAHLDALRIRGKRYAIDMDGEADLRLGEMHGQGQARLHPESADAEPPPELVVLPFGLGGTLTAPVVAAGVPRRDIAPDTVSAGQGGAE